MMAEYCRIIDKIANKHPDIAAKWKSQIAKVMIQKRELRLEFSLKRPF
jgi:hypothetical protein